MALLVVAIPDVAPDPPRKAAFDQQPLVSQGQIIALADELDRAPRGVEQRRMQMEQIQVGGETFIQLQ